MFGRSHYLIMEKLAEELTRRGHEAPVFIGTDAAYAKGKPNVKMFTTPQEFQDQLTQHVKSMTGSKEQFSNLQNWQSLFEMQKTYCNALFDSISMMEDVKSANVVIGDSLYPCSSLVAEKFDIPHVVINISPITTFTLQAFGIHSNPTHVPMFGSGVSIHMNFMDKLRNIGHYFINMYAMYGIVYPKFKSVKEKYNISPKKTIYESLSTVDMLIMPRNYALDYPQPVPPFVKDVGFFLPSPAKTLPAELEEFMQSSGDEGVVLLSFGSMVSTVDTHATQMMMKAFARMPQKFLVKLDTKNLPRGSVPPNVKAVAWLPQNDILGHVKTRLFITHSGANGLAEAAYHGVPMLCSPFFSDQFENSQYVKDIGIAEILRVTTATEDELVNVLKKLLGEKRYKDKASKVSKIMRLRKRTPLEDAADLVEFVQVQGHLDHLKPRSHSLPFYQAYMLDVMAALGISLVVIVGLIVCLLRGIARAFSKIRKTKSE